MIIRLYPPMQSVFITTKGVNLILDGDAVVCEQFYQSYQDGW